MNENRVFIDDPDWMADQFTNIFNFYIRLLAVGKIQHRRQTGRACSYSPEAQRTIYNKYLTNRDDLNDLRQEMFCAFREKVVTSYNGSTELSTWAIYKFNGVLKDWVEARKKEELMQPLSGDFIEIDSAKREWITGSTPPFLQPPRPDSATVTLWKRSLFRMLYSSPGRLHIPPIPDGEYLDAYVEWARESGYSHEDISRIKSLIHVDNISMRSDPLDAVGRRNCLRFWSKLERCEEL